MTKFGKDLIKSTRQAAGDAAGKKELAKKTSHRRSFATADLSDERVRTIGAARMDKRHAQLDNALKTK